MAKTTGALKHIHKYFKRHDGLWACDGLDGCTHYMPKNMDPLPRGCPSYCHSCNKVIQLIPYNMEDPYPKCDECMERLAMIEAVMEGTDADPMFIGMSPSMIAKTKAAIERNRIEREEEELTRVGSMEDLVEVYEADEQHAPDCEIHIMGECTCRS